MWLVAGWGLLSMVFVFILALIPPSQIKGMNLSKTGYILLMLVATLVISIIPLVIYQFKKPSWMPEPRKKARRRRCDEQGWERREGNCELESRK